MGRSKWLWWGVCIANIVAWTSLIILNGPPMLDNYLKSRITSPYIAALYGKADVLEAWLAKGGDPNAPVKEGLTLLQYATSEGSQTMSDMQRRVQTVAVLLRHGADPNKLGYERSPSPLMNAAKLDDLGTFALLLASGADPVPDLGHEESILSYIEREGVPYQKEKLKLLKLALALDRPEDVPVDAGT
ncbi:MAG: ankyrin repeat domain-containing protein [Candidatus Hydrogenedentes bacterium]|nr:ankyrin repeat domain-containing protein [Candidatus Hydrogenedentota bacterium]